jgi:hypothetical protein
MVVGPGRQFHVNLLQLMYACYSLFAAAPTLLNTAVACAVCAVLCHVLQDDLSQYAPDSETQQQIVMSIADRDAFNWG